MKKGFLLLSTMLGLASLTQAQKLALYEEFSGENCGPCAASNPALMTLLNANTSKAVLIKYQSPIPSAGPIYNQNTTDVQARLSYYSVPFAPYARLNGAVVGTGTNAGHIALTTQAMLDAAATETSPFTLTIGTPTITGTSFTVMVTATATSAVANTGLKMRFALVEDLEFATPPGSNGETSFHHVMRKMYPDATGTTVQSAFAVGGTQVFTVTGTIPAYVSAESPRLFVAWIQDDADKTVWQAAKTANLPGAVNAVAMEDVTIADNIKCGATGSFSQTVKIKNNGTAALTTATIFSKVGTGSYVPYSWTGNLASGASTVVNMPAISVNAYGGQTVVDSVALPNGQVDADPSNNTNSGDVYLLNATNEVMPQANDFEAANGLWTGLPGMNGTPFYRANVNTFLTSTVTGSGYNGSSYAICYPFYIFGAGSTGYYTLPQTDMTAAQKALDFYVSYCQYSSENDKLEVVYSTDCGATWTSVWSKAGAALSTKALQTGFFKPSSNSTWRMESVDVSAVPAGARIAFKATSAYGNNLWIDNVNLRPGAPVGINDLVADNSVKVYPNPIQSDLNVTFDLKKATTVTVNVSNALGQDVLVSNAKSMTAGNQVVKLDASTLASGVYYINIVTEQGTIRQKFVKQ